MVDRVAAFTDTYLPTVNGVSYTVRTWRDRWQARGGRMDVAYPAATAYDPAALEHPVRSVPFPFYGGYRLGQPRVPDSLSSVDPDVVHAHTPFSIGLAALRFARRAERPLVASYHTPAAEYAGYLAPTARLVDGVRRLANGYERRYYDRADLVIAPSVTARQRVLDTLGVSTPVRVVSNGVDTARFRPVDPATIRERFALERDRLLVGYTGRHGHEKRLDELLAAVAALPGADAPVTLVVGGDGPARAGLERRARELDVDARFLGFLEREELPALYSALDVFAFPSPVETQGLVALESICCGTPVVAADAGALAETVIDGETGYHYPAGDVAAFARALERALGRRDRLGRRCLDRRDAYCVDRSLERLDELYAAVAG
ncbi:glycosyltransferase [Natrononativus amylolyticus]|uniref:glycosyltransferase n=1 Tax=Natrononativus amylolyticus TaxID=2963434 RepID=UPI0020CE6A33|nr:glycosyltransferase [Natrononativus amylolyticus]